MVLRDAVRTERAAKLHERYTLDRVLGEGAFGLVYEASDELRATRVAIKWLRRLDTDAVLRFKQEFRVLADVVHPNLVALHELFVDGGRWFFAMELVRGESFVSWVRDAAGAALAETVAMSGVMPMSVAAHSVESSAAGTLRVERVAPALRQLAEAIDALHTRGLLHRDLKPSNVLVDRDGRVVVLDFGLVTHLAASSDEQGVSGTPAYMAPEQAAGLRIGPPADVYALGVMLYEALSGRLPFTGATVEVMGRKQLEDPINPRALDPDLPEDLCALALAMMSREPSRRPSAREIVRLLEGDTSVTSIPASSEPDALLVGRQQELAALRQALADAVTDPVTVFVHAPSGMGKTALVRQFLGDAEAGGAIVLDGRCREREAVPFKALDGVIDALIRHLRTLLVNDRRILVGDDGGALARLFPVLVGIPGVRVEADGEAPDVHVLRARAFAALRSIFERMSRARPLVIAIDDLQWGDLDSAPFLTETLRDDPPPRTLVLLGHRTEDEGASALLDRLAQRRREAPRAHERTLALGPLQLADAEALAKLLLEGSAADAARIARESQGNPFFIQQLAAFARSRPLDAEPSLARVLDERIAGLDRPSRALLDTVAVAGSPLPITLLARAASLSIDEAATALVQLRSGRFVRSRGDQEVEAYHDRIRERAHEAAPGRERIHRALADALGDDADPERLAFHLDAAGDLRRAAPFAERVGDRAAATLAFERAASAYRRALAGIDEKDTRARVLEKLGDALACDGRGAEAAHAYLEAGTAGDLRRRAAEQLLRAGHLDEGTALASEVLAEVGITYPKTPIRALGSLLYTRAALRLRGLDLHLRAPSPEELRAVDACWAVGCGLGPVDPVRGHDFLSRHLRLALRAGEPMRIARGLALEGSFAALGADFDYAKRAVALAKSLAEEPHPRALVALCEAHIAYEEGRFEESVRGLAIAEQLFEGGVVGSVWERSFLHYLAFNGLYFVGRIGELSRRVPQALVDAERRGDLYGATNVRTLFHTYVSLARGEPDEARRMSNEGLAGWTQRGFHLQHFQGLATSAQACLYEGDDAGALGLLRGVWSRLERSFLLRMQILRIVALTMRARSALGVAASGRDRERNLADAERIVDRLGREQLAWGRACALPIRAGIAHVRGDEPRAIAECEAAEQAFDHHGMFLFAHAARIRRARALGGDHGRELAGRVTAWSTAEGIVDIDRFARVLIPAI